MSDSFPPLDDDFGLTSSGPVPSNHIQAFVERFPDFSGGTPSFDAIGSSHPALDVEADFDTFTTSSAPAPPSLTSASRHLVDSDFVNEFSRDVGGREVSVTGNDEVSAFENQFPELPSGPAPMALQQNGFSSAGNYSQPPPSQLSQPEPESEHIRAWKEKQGVEIKRRDEASAAKREEMVHKAEEAIDAFYKEYSSKKERQIAKNKGEEEAFLSKQTESLAQGTTWERIANLVELQDSRSKTTTRSTRDLSRMKEVLLSLRREGDTAPGAGGF